MTAKRRPRRFVISLISLAFISATALAATGAVSPAGAATVPRAAAGLPAHTGAASLGWEVGSPVLYDPRSGKTEVYVVGADHALYEKAWNQSMDWSGWINLGGVIITI